MNVFNPDAMLADVGEAGPCFIDETDRDELIAAGERIGLAIARVDLSGCAGKDEVLSRLATALSFPDWFGRNWDALADCLSDMSWRPAPGYLTMLEGIDEWQQAEPAQVDTLLDIFDTTALHWAEHDVAFWLLVPLSAERLSALARERGDIEKADIG